MTPAPIAYHCERFGSVWFWRSTAEPITQRRRAEGPRELARQLLVRVTGADGWHGVAADLVRAQPELFGKAFLRFSPDEVRAWAGTQRSAQTRTGTQTEVTD